MRIIVIPAALVAGFIFACVNFVDRPRCTASHTETKDGFYVFGRGLYNGPHKVAICDQWENPGEKPGLTPRKPQR